jgi:hypothetical protein
MISNIPSVKDTYFQHKVLTKIHGKPSYESLRNILTELKANASSVPSTLGGGQHGHLGLLLSDARYTALPHAIAWITPGNPGAFAPPPAPATGPQIEAAKDVWRELKRTFETSQASEKALIAQILIHRFDLSSCPSQPSHRAILHQHPCSPLAPFYNLRTNHSATGQIN